MIAPALSSVFGGGFNVGVGLGVIVPAAHSSNLFVRTTRAGANPTNSWGREESPCLLRLAVAATIEAGAR